MRRERARATLATDPLIRALTGLFHMLSERNSELARANRTLEARVAERTAALAAANARLEALVRTDALTGLPNRRHALEALDRLWAASALDLTVLLLDLDGFKGVNDTYGHAVGDAVLRKAARALQAAIRTDDLACRLGGDEFLVLLPATDLEGARIVAEHIRTGVAADTVEALGVRIVSRMSIGAAQRSANVATAADLIRLADTALYAAKRAGRDRLVTAAELPTPTRSTP